MSASVDLERLGWRAEYAELFLVAGPSLALIQAWARDHGVPLEKVRPVLQVGDWRGVQLPHVRVQAWDLFAVYELPDPDGVGSGLMAEARLQHDVARRKP